MTYTEIRDLITANETQQGGTDRITGAEVRAVDNAIVDKIEEVEGFIGSGGGGPTIYTADDDLTDNRIIGLAGNSLSIQDGGNNVLYVDQANSSAGFQIFNNSDPDLISYLNIGSGSSTPRVIIGVQDQSSGASGNLDFNIDDGSATLLYTDGSAQTYIILTPSTITATADNHIFNGVVIMMADLPVGDPANPGQLYSVAGAVMISL